MGFDNNFQIKTPMDVFDNIDDAYGFTFELVHTYTFVGWGFENYPCNEVLNANSAQLLVFASANNGIMNNTTTSCYSYKDCITTACDIWIHTKNIIMFPGNFIGP